MATTLKARAGSSIRVQFQYLGGTGDPILTDGMPARIQFSTVSSSPRVVLEAWEYDGPDPVPTNTILTRTGEGTWVLYLGKKFTRSLPPTVAWELELVPTSNPDDQTTVDYGVLKVEPEKVVKVV